MICADREFPESARTLALNGAELILTPNACGLVDAQLRQFATRAAENILGVAMTNYGSTPGVRTGGYNGRSVAYGHDGKALAGPADRWPQTLLATFNITALREARASARGRSRLQGLNRTRLKLCELHRQSAFQRANVYGRVAGSAV